MWPDQVLNLGPLALESDLLLTALCNSGPTFKEKSKMCKDWLAGWCFELNGPLRQYFSLYRAISQREGERKEK